MAMSPELKFSDIVGSVTMASAGTVVCLSNMATGDTVSTRSGNTIRAHDLRFRAQVLAAGAATAITRIIIVRDNACQGATPVTSDILSSAQPVAQLNYVNSNIRNARFKVIYDQFHCVSQANIAEGQYVIDKVIPLKDFQLNYIGAGATTASCGKGAYFLLHIAATTGTYPAIAYESRLRFYDF